VNFLFLSLNGTFQHKEMLALSWYLCSDICKCFKAIFATKKDYICPQLGSYSCVTFVSGVS